MEVSNCKHLRIRDGDVDNLSVEEFIKLIEKKYKIEFTSLPQWKELVKRLHVTSTDYKCKMQDAKLRKTLIIKKIYTELCRPTPFELTDHFARTASKWVQKSKSSKQEVSLKPDPDLTDSTDAVSDLIASTDVENDDNLIDSYSVYNSEVNTNKKYIYAVPAVPPNTEVDKFERIKHSINRSSTNLVLNTLPKYFCKNKHKLVSPLESNDSNLISISGGYEIRHKKKKHRISLQETSFIVSTPKEIRIVSYNLNKQTIKFSVINSNPMKHILYIRFICITDMRAFKKATVLPATPLKLYPGIPVIFNFVFQLVQSTDEFFSQVYFKVGGSIYTGEPNKAFYIPIMRKSKVKSVLVTKTVSIPPIYLWHFKNADYPKGIAQVSVTGDVYYHMHITKRAVDLSHSAKKVIDTYTAYVLEKALERIESEMRAESSLKRLPSARSEFSGRRRSSVKSHVFTPSKSTDKYVMKFNCNEPPYQNIDVIILVIEDVIRLCIDTFKFDRVYKFLEPDSNVEIPVYFTEVEHIGCHNYYYDFEFYDPKTNDFVMIQTVKVFAEVLPHPIKIKPERLLDMSNSKTSHGFCKDTFTILNTHKHYPVSVKILLSKETIKFLNVTPTEIPIPSLSNVTFDVNFCGRDKVMETEDVVHFSLKIIVTGNQSLYRGVPPIDYEIVAPCVNVFKKLQSVK